MTRIAGNEEAPPALKRTIRIALTSIRRQETAGPTQRHVSHTCEKFSTGNAALKVVLHRTEQPGYAFESLRGAVLAANRVCVLAQRSAPEDEKVWTGVFHFEHSSANLTARIGRLLGDPAALARCRRQTYHVFRHRFDVAAIFRRAKVPDLLRSLGWRLPPRSGEGRAQGRVNK